jgi:hypothetical protein
VSLEAEISQGRDECRGKDEMQQIRGGVFSI